jgi:putative ABC transport system permease protein
MLKNYITIALRNFWRNKGFFFINIAGLALGIAAFLFIVAFVNFELSYDSFHERAGQLYRVSVDVYKNGAYELSDAECYNLAGPMMKQDFEEVEDFTNIRGLYTYSIGYRERLFKEDKVLFADPGFLELFSFPVIQGNIEQALVDVNAVVLTQSIASKIFGNEDPLGKQLIVNGTRAVVVTAVIADIPANSHIHFDYLMSYRTGQDMRPNSNWFPNWNGNNGFTYILLSKNADADALQGKLKAFSRKYMPDREEQLVIQPLRDIHLYSHKTFEVEPNRNGSAIKLLMGIGFLILVIAWINYVNLATSRSIERAREVGVRKTLGSQKIQIIRQFMLESFLVNLLALLLAILVADLAYPLVVSITGTEAISWEFGTNLWVYGVLFFIVGTVLSGFYPAWVLSSYKPAAILKGKFQTSTKGTFLRKSLVISQFVASFGLIAGTITIYLQLQYMQQKDLGMNIDQVLTLYSPRTIPDSVMPTSLGTFKDAVGSLPVVGGVGISETIPGNGTADLNSGSGNINRYSAKETKGPVFYNYRVNETYFKTLGIKLLAGRFFSDNAAQNKDRIIINEDALEKLDFRSAEEAVGTKIYWGEYRPEIIGVVENYNHLSLENNYIPLMFFYEPFAGSYITIRLKSGVADWNESIAEIRQAWKRSFGDAAFEYFYLDERFNAQYKSDQQFSRLFTVFTVLAVLIACLGLLGLSAYAVVQRTKEIGIRKVLGASVPEIIKTLSSDFMKLILVAIVIAIVGSTWAIDWWLNSYAFRVQLSWWIMVIPAVALVLMAMLTIGYHTIKAASANPVDSLKTE